MKSWTPTLGAYQLLHEGALALAETSAQGLCVDRAYLNHALADVGRRIAQAETEMRAAPEYGVWRRKYGEKTNLGSPEQLAGVVFGPLGYKAARTTGSGKRWSASEESLESVNLPFVRQYLATQRLRKARGTYLEGIARELVTHPDGTHRVHPSFNMHLVQSFRTSCDGPNVQNQPVRNPEMAEMVRRTYIARPGCVLTEIDYAQQEVRVGQAYHGDKNMLRYIRDTRTDMHRDSAAKMFFLTKEQAKDKTVRHIAKNKFVFPQFYGSYFAQCAPSIWLALESLQPKVAGTDTTVLAHLAANGVTSLGACDPKQSPVPGTFEHHLKGIEDYLWGTQFPEYAAWKKAWFAAYQRDGGCRFLSGFVMTGPHKKNDITNYCIQGDASNCLVWSLVKINRLLRRYRMQTRAVCPIHDCILFDGPPAERNDLVAMCRQVMVEDVRGWATWLTAPLDIEAETCPLGGTWFDKHALVDQGGRLVPANLAKWEKMHGPWELQEAA